MKVAITSSGTTLEAAFDTRFGRAANFIIYDTDNNTWESHSNSQNYEAVQGAGIQAAQTVKRLGASVLITGHVGPKAFKVLNANNVKIFAASVPDAKDAIAAYKKGELSEIDTANVEGHWV
jgi:predicted Fe-Mo cluster-binding NifX family protein